ncbi:MAG: hypothetical protein ACKOXZ_08270, partial [Polynucleobacter victoriensis]
MSGSEHSSCTILLDDAHSQDSNPTSRLYQEPQQTIVARNASELDAAFAKIELALRQKKYVVTCLSYELGEHLIGITPNISPTPWVQAWAFDSVQRLSSAEVQAWLSQPTSSESKAPKVENCLPSTNSQAFEKSINTIKSLIESGDTYQVNHTYRIHGQ